jgi:hypothetical protein
MNRQTDPAMSEWKQKVAEQRFRPRRARRLVEQRGQEGPLCLPQRQPPRQPQRQHRFPVCPQLDRGCARARTGSGWRPAPRPDEAHAPMDQGPSPVRHAGHATDRAANRKAPGVLVGPTKCKLDRRLPRCAVATTLWSHQP